MRLWGIEERRILINFAEFCSEVPQPSISSSFPDFLYLKVLPLVLKEYYYISLPRDEYQYWHQSIVL
jgi:hypothetical protein